ncbi:hypothetical protein [Candidatus Sororendozoicomonas aggregata]|uniref:hypothetical protein n=1 Tax=Candidatus Sororendozoicomonas aggregata TaxID=3073239 RepID=UPI002ED33463
MLNFSFEPDTHFTDKKTKKTFRFDRKYTGSIIVGPSHTKTTHLYEVFQKLQSLGYTYVTIEHSYIQPRLGYNERQAIIKRSHVINDDITSNEKNNKILSLLLFIVSYELRRNGINYVYMNAPSLLFSDFMLSHGFRPYYQDSSDVRKALLSPLIAPYTGEQPVGTVDRSQLKQEFDEFTWSKTSDLSSSQEEMGWFFKGDSSKNEQSRKRGEWLCASAVLHHHAQIIFDKYFYCESSI